MSSPAKTEFERLKKIVEDEMDFISVSMVGSYEGVIILDAVEGMGRLIAELEYKIDQSEGDQ